MPAQLKPNEAATLVVANLGASHSIGGLRVLERFRHVLETTGRMPQDNLPLCRIAVSPRLANQGHRARRHAWMLKWLIRFTPIFLVLFCILLPLSLLVPVVALALLLEPEKRRWYRLREFLAARFLPQPTAFAPVEIEWGSQGLTLRQRCDIPAYMPPGEHRLALSRLLDAGPGESRPVNFARSSWQLACRPQAKVYYSQSYAWDQIHRLSLRRVRRWSPENTTLFRLRVQSWFHMTQVCFDLDPKLADQLERCLQATLEIQRALPADGPRWQRLLNPLRAGRRQAETSFD